MKLIKILIAVLMVFGVAQASAKEPKAPKAIVVYAVGVATSFNDSVAYLTEMQVLNDATLDRDRYLHRRSGYSFQLRDYLLGQGKENFTCLVLFNAKKAKLEKELGKVRARFAKDNISLIEIKEADFKFTKPEEL
ncbi:MAG: hypothetical protein IJ534_04060 [Bacteroidaceae bacterium]|jgi:hypothetical protein|nr:hypothetical protein [Bacteroidaceae bacterium]